MDTGPYPERENWVCLRCRDDPVAMLDYTLDWADRAAETSVWRFFKAQWAWFIFGSWIWVPLLIAGPAWGGWWWTPTIVTLLLLIVGLPSDMRHYVMHMERERTEKRESAIIDYYERELAEVAEPRERSQA